MIKLLKLTLAVYCVALCLNGVTAQGRLKEAPRGRFEGENEDGREQKIPADRFKLPPEYVNKLKIKELEFSEEKTTDWASKGVEQIEEKVQFQIPNTSEKSEFSEISEVSLFYFDSEEAVWVEESAQKEEMSICVRRFQCTTTVTLRKPLIGYDLLKSAGCGGEQFKEQPYQKGRWGVSKERKVEREQCSMVIVRTGMVSVAQIYPDAGCPQRELEIFRKENPVLINPGYQKRNTFEHRVTNFHKAHIGNNIKFVCKIRYTHYGYSTSLGNGNPSADVTVYYRPNGGSGWGNYLLDLNWKNFNPNTGKNKYKSVVSAQHLINQGVNWTNCFKCEVIINGVKEKGCFGPCHCD